MPKLFSVSKVKWFQLSVLLASAVLLFLLVASVVIAHGRGTGATGVDAGDIQQIREKINQQDEA
jgi:hypothetical protein